MTSNSLVDTTLRLIKTFGGLGPSRCHAVCGHDVPTVAAAYNSFFPDNPLTELEVSDLLHQQSQRGVFKKGGFSADGNFHYHVNPGMASVNPANSVYVQTSFDDTVASHGFLPCGYDLSYHPHPHGVAVSSSGQFSAGLGGNAGTNTSGGFIACD